MFMRHVATGLVFAAALGTLAPHGARAERLPNFVVILIDDKD
jgi:hypothetical protein